MGWLEAGKSGVLQICFRFGDERIKRSSRTKDKRKALTLLGRVEENLSLVLRGRLTMPDDADVFEFLISDGRLNGVQAVKPTSLRIDEVFRRYRDSLPPNALSPETLRVAAIHMRHAARILGGTKQLRTVARDDLQCYVNTRATERGKRKREVSPGTIKKELATLRTLWGWAQKSDYVSKPFPNDGLAFPRGRQKMPFATWDQIEQRIQRGMPAGYTEADYWDCLYLDREQLKELLTFIREHAAYDFLYPMAALAAHTGARRSELCRSVREDVDLESGTILIRERKKMKGQETFRHVPLSPLLRQVLANWLAASPLSIYTFPADHRVFRPWSVQRRENPESVSPDEASDHLSQTLSGSRWETIRGWHIFRPYSQNAVRRTKLAFRTNVEEIANQSARTTRDPRADQISVQRPRGLRAVSFCQVSPTEFRSHLLPIELWSHHVDRILIVFMCELRCGPDLAGMAATTRQEFRPLG